MRREPALKPKTASELAKMRVAGQIVAHVLHELRGLVQPGCTTQELDAVAERMIRAAGAVPSFKGYHGYPATICTSVNEEVVHGIPGPRVLKAGDIVSIDAGAIWEGYQGDAAITVALGSVNAVVQGLLDATVAALHAGIAATRGGARLGDVSHAIEGAARDAGYEVVREYGGHGIGQLMHEPPRIPNWGPAGRGVVLPPGLTLALEPMLTLGGFATRTLADQWTVVTVDGSYAAHYEHTIVVTESGGEVLTPWDGDTLTLRS
jgi:methionyl aminopeptidase